MITVRFLKAGSKPMAFTLSGHAGYADAGKDIVCAGVSSAVMLTANAITEQFREKAEVTVEENKISLQLPQNAGIHSVKMLEALMEHLKALSEDYPKTIKITVSEV